MARLINTIPSNCGCHVAKIYRSTWDSEFIVKLESFGSKVKSVSIAFNVPNALGVAGTTANRLINEAVNSTIYHNVTLDIGDDLKLDMTSLAYSMQGLYGFIGTSLEADILKARLHSFLLAYAPMLAQQRIEVFPVSPIKGRQKGL